MSVLQEPAEQFVPGSGSADLQAELHVLDSGAEVDLLGVVQRAPSSRPRADVVAPTVLDRLVGQHSPGRSNEHDDALGRAATAFGDFVENGGEGSVVQNSAVHHTARGDVEFLVRVDPVGEKRMLADRLEGHRIAGRGARRCDQGLVMGFGELPDGPVLELPPGPLVHIAESPGFVAEPVHAAVVPHAEGAAGGVLVVPVTAVQGGGGDEEGDALLTFRSSQHAVEDLLHLALEPVPVEQRLAGRATLAAQLVQRGHIAPQVAKIQRLRSPGDAGGQEQTVETAGGRAGDDVDLHLDPGLLRHLLPQLENLAVLLRDGVEVISAGCPP
ncbi:hypothetical protein GCM10010206_18040 [Streptomyces cinerochromogenes]|nr:hypothetical protein [Streptomyces cinerochromogenes]GGS56460.1 hypothetical protein GCM10010206_18040 [Streptomyces cinerochromogenes]